MSKTPMTWQTSAGVRSKSMEEVIEDYFNIKTEKLVKEIENFFNDEGIIISKETEDRLKAMVKSHLQLV